MLTELEWVWGRVQAQEELWRVETDVFHFPYLLDMSSNLYSYMMLLCSAA